MFKKAIDQYIQDTIQVFQIWHNVCSELTSMWTFKMYSRNIQATNEPTASNNKSDRPQVNIWDTWKTWKYLNINDSFHLKGLEISKYKRESKARMQIKMFCLIFVNCGLFSFLNIEKVKIYNENTIADGNVLCKRIHSNFTVVKELRSKMFGQHPGYFKAVFLKQTRISIVCIYKYNVYIMFWIVMLYDCYYY